MMMWSATVWLRIEPGVRSMLERSERKLMMGTEPTTSWDVPQGRAGGGGFGGGGGSGGGVRGDGGTEGGGGGT